MKTTLFFWRQQPWLAFLPAAIAQQLDVGNEVEGLIDLPVQEILAQLKTSFPGSVERAGELAWSREEEAFEATWSWQYVRLECQELSDDSHSRLALVFDAFDCPAYDPQLGIRLEP